MSRRRPSLLWLALRYGPMLIGALAIACVVMAALSGCASAHRANSGAMDPSAPELARTAAVTDQAVTAPASHTVTLEWCDTVTNRPLPKLNEIHAAPSLTDPLPWLVVHVQTNSVFLCTREFDYTQTNRTTVTGPVTARFFYLARLGFDGLPLR